MNAAILFIIILFGLLLLCLIATKLNYFEGYTNKNTLWADICNKEKEDGVPEGSYGCYTGHTGSIGHTGHTGHTERKSYFTPYVRYEDTPASPDDWNDSYDINNSNNKVTTSNSTNSSSSDKDEDNHVSDGSSDYNDDESVTSQNRYMLKSACLPPICPTCPDMVYPDKSEDENNKTTYNPKAPYPILPDFTSFGV